MILIITTNNKKLDLCYFEFVKPIEKIVKKNYKTISIFDINENFSFEKFSHIIICGTCKKDFEFEKIKKINFPKIPILGICSGAQIIGKNFDCKIIKDNKIKVEEIKIIKKNKLLKNINSKKKGYFIHSFNIIENDNFLILAKNKTNQILKHKKLEIYLFLFHIEVGFKKIIFEFLSI